MARGLEAAAAAGASQVTAGNYGAIWTAHIQLRGSCPA